MMTSRGSSSARASAVTEPYGHADNASTECQGANMLYQQKNSLSTPHTGLCRLLYRLVRQPVICDEISGCTGRNGFWTMTTHLEHYMDAVLCFVPTMLEQFLQTPTSTLFSRLLVT
ncbi:unnamed protein product [Nippostrongylus brasiliensis]|uniref:Uncharacterized protein n=1 Tax=Nippostrongylus brasiliensis TaxID=27835 RepID=A0A0N4YTJ8_NIPBR|nr:unnamed protein product [Nippostrongylus brasiliensis]